MATDATVVLAPEAIEAIALRTAELLAGMLDGAPSAAAGASFIDAAEVARRFGVSRGFVYEHAERLGARRLGDGPRARLRFDLEQVAERLGALGAEKSTAPKSRRPAPRRRRPSGDVELLPIRGPRL